MKELTEESVHTRYPRISKLYVDAPLVVDSDARTVSREGKNALVDLSSGPILWHIFQVAYTAAGRQVDLDDMSRGYPGEFNDNARTNAYVQLNRKLASIGVKLRNRVLADDSNS